MSALEKELSADQLKAPTGMFRVVQVQMRQAETEVVPDKYFLIEDYAKRGAALDRWRALLDRRTVRDKVRYRIYDDHGRINDAVGAFITEAERIAPKGMFRIVCGDTASGQIKLVKDMDDQADAIDYAMTADEGPYTGFQVHDDTGAALIPLR